MKSKKKKFFFRFNPSKLSQNRLAYATLFSFATFGNLRDIARNPSLMVKAL